MKKQKELYDNFGKVISKDELGMPYEPVSKNGYSLQVNVPDSMGFETHEALKKVNNNIGGNTSEFVADRLNYSTIAELNKSLALEQIDAVALAIYNIEAYSQGIIIGDQTGIGKGRQAAAIIRYAVEQGMQPIFLTEKPNLFSDIYRDLIAIGSGHLVPFIVNGKESKTQVKDEDGNLLFEALETNAQNRIFESKNLPARYNFVMATYSQFNSAEKKPLKPDFLKAIADNNVLILDEAHNASGSSQTGEFLKEVVNSSKGVLFLSATFAKRPDNMPIYALKTAINESNMQSEDLTEAIERGGVALQEILASQLVKEAQMLRRERTYEGIEVNYITLTELEKRHRAISDGITNIIRDIIIFQKVHVEKIVEDLDEAAKGTGSIVEQRKCTSKAGVDNLPYFSKVFNIINQMLFSIKAEAVADRAIMRLKQGKKPVIAFASTMESFLQDLDIADGESINADFSIVLERGLNQVLRITTKDEFGNATYQMLKPMEVSPECFADYKTILAKINRISTGITISPIDIIKQKIQAAGYTVAEVTGRKSELQINPKNLQAIVKPRQKINTNDAFRKFNNNEVDVLMINQSGSTGASAHAIPTNKVSEKDVKQRVMIVLQPELDINREVQKRGRINRTGQIILPIYDYVSSAIPAEQRLMMMLQRKLKSLDANTTSNQKNSSSLLSVPDFLNKIGDKIVYQYLWENPKVNELLDNPLDLGRVDESEDKKVKEDAAHKVSGRVAILDTAMQQKFYDEIIAAYNDQVEYLKQIGEYDLEVETLDLRAKILNKKAVIFGNGGRSQFGTNSYLELVDANVLKKPYTRSEVDKMLSTELKKGNAEHLKTKLIKEYEAFLSKKQIANINELNKYYKEQIANVTKEKKLKQLPQNAHKAYIDERRAELQNSLNKEIENSEKTLANQKNYLINLFEFFYVGRGVNYPVSDYENGFVNVPAICLGVTIDTKRDNPYAYSAIKIRFAIADSNRYVTLVTSGEQGQKLQGIIAASIKLTPVDNQDTLKNWAQLCSKSNVNRKNRYIITGNILQAFSKYKGNLVSYTTDKNDIKKGILMPDNWRPDERKENFVSVPIIGALNIILKLADGTQITTNNNIVIKKNYNSDVFMVLIPGTNKQGGEFYKNKDLIDLTTEKNFHSVSGFMRGFVELKDMKKFVALLQQFKLSVSVHQNIVKDSDISFDEVSNATPVKLHIRKKVPQGDTAPKQKSIKTNEVNTLELEALAIELELELLTI